MKKRTRRQKETVPAFQHLGGKGWVAHRLNRASIPGRALVLPMFFQKCFIRCICLVIILSSLISCGESSDDASNSDPHQASLDYVIRFLPRYYTYKMQIIVPKTFLISPSKVTSVFRNIVAPNVDTIYAATLLDLSTEPMVLTIPDTDLRFSVQLMDLMTEVLPNNIGSPGGHSYAFTGPQWNGALPPDMQRITLPVNGAVMIARVNKNLGDRDVSARARELVNSLALRTLSGTRDRQTLVIPQVILAQSTKLAIDREASETPLVFLANLQEAVQDPLTPLTQSDRQLMNQFDRCFQGGSTGDKDPVRQSVLNDMATGVAEAYRLVRLCYLSSDETAAGWRFFPDTGRWGGQYLDRASVGEYFLYANIESRAQYYYVYQDEHGMPLNGKAGASYEIHFPSNQIPRAGSFWSLTGYNNDAISFIPNDENQYNVPSYRQGLVTEPDGSVVIYLQQDRPPAVLVPNWLPIDENPFHVILRVFEPQTPYADYEPPAVQSGLR